MSPERTKTPLPCDIVRDLLPLYHDGVVSEATGQAVEDHLEGCEPCRREYAALCADLPAVSAETDSTGDQFVDTMRKAKRKRTLATLLAVVLTCGLLAGVLVFLDQVTFLPLPPEETQVEKVYRFEDDGETKFFVYLSMPVYTHYISGRYVPSEENPDTLVMQWNRTFWGKPYVRSNGEIDWMEDILLIDATREDGDYTTLMLNDQVIWTEEANGDDPVPDYVYAYNDFFEGPDAQLVNYSNVLTDRAARAEPVEGFFYDLDRNVIGINYANGDLVTWNLAGELLTGTYPPEN